MAQIMLKTMILLLCLVSIGIGLNCQYNTESSCIYRGCKWTTNSTCITGDGLCQTGWAISQALGECVQCSTQPQSTCTSLCSTYYYVPTTGPCQLCSLLSANCLTCTPFVCQSCESGFELSSDSSPTCLAQPCLIPNCNVCESASTCYACNTGYNPITNLSICFLSVCSISNCLFCVEASSCTTCRANYELSQNSNACNLICDDKFCDLCTTSSSCSKCKDGYYFSTTKGACLLTCNVQYCQFCDLSSTCTGCKTGYEVNTAKTKCTAVCSDSSCQVCTISSYCDTCALGFISINGICAFAICMIQSCATCQTSSTCNQCNNISTLSDDKRSCIQNCMRLIENCKICSSNDTCSSCIPGYNLANNKCTVVCTIDNCEACLSSSFCSICKDGYTISNDEKECKLNCGIKDCLVCQSKTTCLTCNSIFALSSDKKSCSLQCPPGNYLNVNSCDSCTKIIPNCVTCFFSDSNLVCSSCLYTYYGTGDGQCKLCSSIIPNCLSCDDPVNCRICKSGYELFYQSKAYICKIPYSCNVANCLLCLSTNPNICTNCSSSYYLVSNGQNCSKIICQDIQYYYSNIQDCKCPARTFLSNDRCIRCQVNYCISCNSAGCLECDLRYYASQGKCLSCVSNCYQCISGTSCITCDYGFVLNDGNCKQTSSRSGQAYTGDILPPAQCPSGCQTCTYFQSNIYCTSPKSGHAIDQNGQVLKCSDDCKTCLSTNYQLCTSCYGSSTLLSGQCQGCSDPYALKCPVNLKQSTTCIIGYSAFNGTCKPCASNCIQCSSAGQGKCDPNSCSSGYVILRKASNCTKCFKSCATCTSIDPAECLTCGTSLYLSSTSECLPCPSVCFSCSSPIICTSCPYNYILQDNWCYTLIPRPCQAQDKNNCTVCYLGYTLTQNRCIIDSSCNATKTCMTCDKNYYLVGGQCLQCKTSSVTCDYCQPSSPGECLTCVVGYYLRRSTNNCRPCSEAMTGCVECNSKNQCTVAASGYYLEVNFKGEYTGKAAKCGATCATCSIYDSCDSCATNYQLKGTTCVYYKNIVSKIVLGSAAGSDQWFKTSNDNHVALSNAFVNLNQIISAIAAAAGVKKSTVIVLTLFISQINIQTVIQVGEDSDLAAFSSKYETNLQTIADFTLISKNLVINGDTSTSNSIDIGLILGVSIPLIILLAVMIIIVKIKMNSDDEVTNFFETQKEIDYA